MRVDEVADSPPEALAPLRAMIERLPSEAIEEIARALHGRLNVPPAAAERRVGQLGFLTRLLNEQPQPPERLPYVSRKVYDRRRPIDAPHAPPSARLQGKFGSWTRACHAAWGLLEDGRSFGDGQPWPKFAGGRPYEQEEAAASVLCCAQSIGRIPSSNEYDKWALNRRARTRARGGNVRTAVQYQTVLRLFAPDRCGRNGWQLVVSRVFGEDARA